MLEREPILRVPEELTALPGIDASLPILTLFGSIVGRRRARYKLAVLKALQADGSGRWKIRRLQEIVDWLEPSSVTDLVAELRTSGVLVYDAVTGYYRLTPDARVVVAILDALTVPEVEPRRLIKFLNKAMSLALAAGAGRDAVFDQFLSAVAVLQGDWEELRRLIDDFSEDALLEAASLVRAHVDDMRELLDEHEAFFAQHRGEALFLSSEQDALDLVAKNGKLSAEVIEALTGRATDRMRGGMRIDRSDLREFLVKQSRQTLALIVEGLAIPPPSVGWVPIEAAFEALVEAAGRQRPDPPELPEPSEPARLPVSAVFDPFADVARELLALRQEVTFTEVIVRKAWDEAIARSGAVVAAYTRDASSLPAIEDSGDVDEPMRGDVWRISNVTLHPRNLVITDDEAVVNA
jgi:hypothetical protein